MRAYKRPDRRLARVSGQDHHRDWLNAIVANRQSGSPFAYGGPLTEIALLGVIAIRFPERELKWDAEKMRFTNAEEANAYVAPPYRRGWEL